MKVLWLTNVTVSEIADAANISKTNFGGWIQGLYNSIMSDCKTDIQLTLVFPAEKSLNGKINNTAYYSFKESKDSDEMKTLFSSILKDVEPDLVHIFGTEYLHSFSMMTACNENNISNTLVSIQGLVSVYARHMYTNLPYKVYSANNLFDMKYKTSIKSIRSNFLHRGEYEKNTLLMAKNVAGRTDWDEQCVHVINQSANYFYCGEILRNSFYSKEKWVVDKCERNSIFFSQCDISIKGVHNAIEAVKILKTEIKEIKLYVAGGTNILSAERGMSSYERYVLNLIGEYNLNENVVFLGPLNEVDMHKRFLNSNVFVCASSIENSSNSVCEAMMAGTPVVASYVGGMSNLITHGENGFLYQADAPYMLAYYIKSILLNDELALNISKRAVEEAEIRHSREKIVADLRGIYNKICENE